MTYRHDTSLLRHTPAIVSDPTYLSAPILMTNPQDPNDPSNYSRRGVVTHGVGAFMGIALTESARIRKHSKQLLRTLEKLDKLQAEADELEGKLEDDGVDVSSLYEGWGFDDPMPG